MCFLNVPQHGNISSFNGLGVPTSKACSHVEQVKTCEHEVPCGNMSFQCVPECHVGVAWVPHWQHIIALLAGCHTCASTSGSCNKCVPKLETFFECTQIFKP
jgi:hypothetical protein